MVVSAWGMRIRLLFCLSIYSDAFSPKICLISTPSSTPTFPGRLHAAAWCSCWTYQSNFKHSPRLTGPGLARKQLSYSVLLPFSDNISSPPSYSETKYVNILFLLVPMIGHCSLHIASPSGLDVLSIMGRGRSRNIMPKFYMGSHVLFSFSLAFAL